MWPMGLLFKQLKALSHSRKIQFAHIPRMNTGHTWVSKARSQEKITSSKIEGYEAIVPTIQPTFTSMYDKR